MSDNFKTEYISELIIIGYTKEEAKEQYQSELKSINQMDFELKDIEEEYLYSI